MINPDDKKQIIQLMRNPAWSILERQVREEVDVYRSQAEQGGIETDYRLMLFAKAQGIEEFFKLAKRIIE